MNLSDSQISLLRTRPHNTKLWLSVYRPNVIFTAQVDDATITKGAYQITYGHGVPNEWLNVKPGMTMYVGDSNGIFNKGSVRVRSITSNVVTVAENSYIEWANRDSLSIVNFFEINAVYPRIILSGTSTIWYKDYDIVYTNQNSNLGFFPCMGSHYAGFLDGGVEQVYYSATGSYNLQWGLTGTASYHWLFEGGTPTGSNLLTPGWVSYTTPGHYTTSLVISGTSVGEASYRHISIYDRPENGTNVPILQWELISLDGDRENSGYNAKIRIYETITDDTILQIRDGALIVIFADDWYGYQQQSIGGNQPNRESIVFSGYIINGSISYNYRDNYIEFEVGSPTEIMKLSEAFAVSITDCDTNPVTAYTNDPNNPSPWMLLQDMDVKKSIYHYMKWHSTILNCCDVQFLSSDNYMTGCDFDRSSLYDAVNTLMSSALFGRMTSDRQGKLWLEREAYVAPDYYEYSPLLLDKQDWINTPSIEERQTDATSYIEMGGVAYAGVTGTAVPLLSAAPGTTPSYRGTVLRVQGLALASQSELNNICGYLYEYNNSRYPTLSYDLAGNYRNIDIAPQQKYILLIDPSDTPRGKAIQLATHVQSVRFLYSPEDELLLTSADFSQLPVRILSSTSTGTYSDVTNYSGTTVSIPELPPFPSFPPLPPFVFPSGSSAAGGSNYTYGICVRAQVGLSPNYTYEYHGAYGVRLIDNDYTDVYGTVLCHKSGYITFYAMFFATPIPSGNIWLNSIQCDILHFGLADTVVDLTDALIPVVLTSSSYTVYAVASGGVSAGDIFNFDLQFDRTDVQDTAGDDVYFLGILGVYT